MGLEVLGRRATPGRTVTPPPSLCAFAFPVAGGLPAPLCTLHRGLHCSFRVRPCGTPLQHTHPVSSLQTPSSLGLWGGLLRWSLS